MTKQERERAYADWREAYIEDVRERVKHWGDIRRNAAKLYRSDQEDTAYAE